MQPARHVLLDPAVPLDVLTATARGMIERNFIHAAQRAHTELMTAVAESGLLPEVRTRVGLLPDTPCAPNDARCRYLAGVLFGHDLAARRGPCRRPAIPLTGSLAWMQIPTGRYAVFTHVGPYDTLHHSWQAIYRDWLPMSGEVLGRPPPMELNLNAPGDALPKDLHTELWLPLA